MAIISDIDGKTDAWAQGTTQLILDIRLLRAVGMGRSPPTAFSCTGRRSFADTEVPSRRKRSIGVMQASRYFIIYRPGKPMHVRR